MFANSSYLSFSSSLFMAASILSISSSLNFTCKIMLKMTLIKKTIATRISQTAVSEKLSIVEIMNTYRKTLPKPKLRNINHYMTEDFSSSINTRTIAIAVKYIPVRIVLKESSAAPNEMIFMID